MNSGKLINFPEKITKDIKTYQEKTGITTFTGAVLELIRKGIEVSK